MSPPERQPSTSRISAGRSAARTILADINLQIGKGELVAVIGPNGAGKSTLVNMISGVTRPSTGRILLDGTDVTRMPMRLRARAGIGRTFQTSSLFGGLTSLQNVCFALQSATSSPLNPLRRAVSAAILDEGQGLLDRVGMGAPGILVRPPRSRTATSASSNWPWRWPAAPTCCCSTSRWPGCRWRTCPGLVQLIADLNGRASPSAWWSTTCTSCSGLADRIAVLHHGRMLAVGSPAEVMADETVSRAYLGDAL